MSQHIVELTPVYIESSNEKLGSATLRKFQKQLLDVDKELIVLSAPTGSGKTVTLLTDLDRRVSVGLYPNNELLRNQVAGLHNFIVRYLGMKPVDTSLLNYCIRGEIRENYIPINFYESDYPITIREKRVDKIYVVGMSGEVVKTLGEKGKLDTLVEVSNKLVKIPREESNKYAIVLATPDTFFLLTLYLYQDFNLIGRLVHYLLSNRLDEISEIDRVMRKIGLIRSSFDRIARVILPLRESTLFVDEYHLYSFYELSSFKALIYILRHIHDWYGRLVLSSATPNYTFKEELEKELGYNSVIINGIEQVKEKGSFDELVRGPIKLVFHEVDAGKGNRISRLYRSSELSYELIHTDYFQNFMESYVKGSSRGLVIVEKVSHAELFSEKLYEIFKVKPICMYSMFRRDLCSEYIEQGDRTSLIIVGTGAKIGQGVEYPNISFGVIARITAPDFLQSLSRIGRKYPGESTVLVPLSKNEVEEAMNKSVFSAQKLSYRELAEWVEKSGKPFMKRTLSGYGELYSRIIAFRENLLKIIGSILHYRLTGIQMRALTDLDQISTVSKLVVSPDYLYSLLMFRSTGPSVTYCREIDHKLECGKEDLGIIIRNYEVESRNGNLLIKRIGTGDIDIVCEKLDILIDFVKSHKLLLLGWSILRDWFKCFIKTSDRPCEDSNRLFSVEKELEDTVFLVPEITNEELAEYIYRIGRGLRIRSNKGSVILLYI